jgi:hypothetical protein
MLSPAPSTMLQVSAIDGKTTETAGTMAFAVRDQMKTGAIISMMHTDASFCYPKSIYRLIIQGSILTVQRNELIQRMKGDWILFVDDDMVWDADAVGRLYTTMVVHDLEVVGGLCFRRSYPHQPTLYLRERPNDGLYHNLESWKDGEVIEVDATGTSFLMVSMQALEKLIGGPMPPYEMRVNELLPPSIFRWDGVKGEDIRFCEDLKAAGVKIFVDTSIKIRHIGDVEITDRHFFQAISEREPEAEALMRSVNDKFGIATLTAKKARRKLYGAK